MAKGILFFCFVLALVHLAIYSLRKMSGKEQFSLLKTLTYSLTCAIIAAAFVSLIVVLF